MNTKTMEQFTTLRNDMLADITGGEGIITTIVVAGLTYFGKKVIDGAIADSTRSCQRNPRQWFCIKV